MTPLNAVLTALNVRDAQRDHTNPGFFSGLAAMLAALFAAAFVAVLVLGPFALVCYTAYKIVQMVVG
jgi:hypothetical protein